jgi:hypothetical protein
MTPQESRAEINRANSQHSTGPKSQAGKQRSALNALRHGLTSQIVVMPEEDLLAYQEHVDSFTTEYHPEGATESQLVQLLADTSWRLNRASALETNVLSLAVAREPNIVDGPEQIQNALAMASALETQSKTLANLSLHTQRLSRQFERTVTQLRELQQTRQTQEKRELDDLLDIQEMYQSRSEPYNPSEDGFVFSKPQIAAAQTLRRRQSLALEAYSFRRAS